MTVETMMPDQPGPFHDHVVAALSRIETQVIGINARLDKQNGSIAKLFEGQSLIVRDLLMHKTDCPLRDDVREIERRLSTGDYPGSIAVKTSLDKFNDQQDTIKQSEALAEGRREASMAWLRWLRPVLYFVGGALALVLLLHAGDIVRMIQK